ncbi:MAG: hypothetical protein WDM80_09220 [Limisphaerales bacterium]
MKAPGRLLLLTFVMSAEMMLAAKASTPRLTMLSSHVNSQAAVTKSPRARPETDFTRIEGIQRWGLNE